MQLKPLAKQTPIAAAIPAAAKEKATGAIPSFDDLPDSALIRERQLVQSYKRPDVPAPVPFSSATLWRKVRMGEFPQPIKLGERITAWKVGEVRQWLQSREAA